MSDAWSEIYTAPEKTGPAPKVSWALKLWGQFTEADKAGLNRHMGQLKPEQRREYGLYLSQYCKVPKGFLGVDRD